MGDLPSCVSSQGRVGVDSTGASRLPGISRTDRIVGIPGNARTPATLRLRLFLLPPWPDASENLPGFLNIAGAPKTDTHSPDFLQWGRVNSFSRDVPLQSQERDA